MAKREHSDGSFHSQQAEIERARELIKEGAAQIDRGEVVDGETFFQE